MGENKLSLSVVCKRSPQTPSFLPLMFPIAVQSLCNQSDCPCNYPGSVQPTAPKQGNENSFLVWQRLLRCAADCLEPERRSGAVFLLQRVSLLKKQMFLF